VVKVYFLEPRNSLKMWGTCFSWGPMLHDGPVRKYLRHGLLLAVYAEVGIRQRPHTVACAYCKQCKNCNIATRNRSLDGTANMLQYVFGGPATCVSV